jgi:hypothetical protein
MYCKPTSNDFIMERTYIS